MMYQAVCDRCGRSCAETGGIMAWANQDSARIAAWKSGWLLVNHETYCHDCVEYDEKKMSINRKTKIKLWKRLAKNRI